MRRREYLIDGAFLVALSLRDAEESPTVHEILHKLQYPEGVLYIGRRPCIPSAEVGRGVVQAPSLLDALRSVRAPTKAPLRTYGPESEGIKGRVVEVTEDKDWKNGIHTGRRRMCEGRMSFQTEEP
jgi:CRISPR system Cascade subunit CasD